MVYSKITLASFKDSTSRNIILSSFIMSLWRTIGAFYTYLETSNCQGLKYFLLENLIQTFAFLQFLQFAQYSHTMDYGIYKHYHFSFCANTFSRWMVHWVHSIGLYCSTLQYDSTNFKTVIFPYMCVISIAFLSHVFMKTFFLKLRWQWP